MRNKAVFIYSVVILLCFTFINIVNADEKQDIYLYVASNLFEKGKYSEALSNYQKALGLGKISIKDQALMGICYVKVGKYKEAKTLIDNALISNPENALLLLAAGILKFDEKKYKEAYDYFNKAYTIDQTLIQAKKGEVSSLVNMGVSSYRTDKKGASEYFKKALDLNPTFVPALQNLAVLSFENSNIKRAMEYINRALKYEPANNKVLELKYYIFYRQKDYSNQIKVLLRLVILYPNDPEYWAMLGKAYEETGQIKKSIEAFSNARRYDSSNPYPYYQLAQYYFKSKSDNTRAIYILREGSGKAVYLIGQIKVSAMAELRNKKSNLTENDIKKIEEMAKSIEKPKKILDNSLILLRNLSKDDETYKKELAHLIELYPHTVELQVALAKLYTEKKLYKDAVGLWRFILIKYSRNIEAYKGISYCYKKMGDRERALKSYKIALDINPNDKSIYENIIELYSEKNKIEDLYKEWSERLYMDKRNPVLLRELAKVEKMLGKYKDAKKQLKRADVVERENKAYEEKQRLKNEN